MHFSSGLWGGQPLIYHLLAPCEHGEPGSPGIHSTTVALLDLHSLSAAVPLITAKAGALTLAF